VINVSVHSHPPALETWFKYTTNKTQKDMT
jgi:hypothetical protein